MRGNITKRGKNSWRIKFDLESDADGNRQTRYVTVKGTRKDAERELNRLIGTANAEPSLRIKAPPLPSIFATG
jgi:hypothetical protein